MSTSEQNNAERLRLAAQREGAEDWRLWGPYLAERAWGTVREDYSPNGTAWEHFPHDHARSRAYRWNEDGLGGLSDAAQRLCFSVALWNGRDPILKERAFGLTGNEGNRSEDVKEYYFYRDATPSHSYLLYRYKYPQAAYPYTALIDENRHRTRRDASFNLLDSGVFDGGRYWDIDVAYAKATPTELHIRIDAYNRGPDAATLHLLPTLWFRNTWDWGDPVHKPELFAVEPPLGAAWCVRADDVELGSYFLCGRQRAEQVFTENTSNAERLWGVANPTPFVKDAFHRRVIDNDAATVNAARRGTKFAAWSSWQVEGGAHVRIDLIFSNQPSHAPFDQSEAVFLRRQAEADAFYDDLLPDASPQDRDILRQAAAGLVWTKQFFHYDVERWMQGDLIPPPEARKSEFARNRHWRHLRAHDVISMPDAWEYPWFAAWDLAYHCIALSLIDVDFAKDQMELLVSERYLHANGQIPAYEWAFGDVNPPVHAMGVLKVFRAERVQNGRGDLGFLQRTFHKLLLNFTWWINRKDADGQNLFEGGFLGLDNISAIDRSQLGLPAGWTLKQADATGWMAMFSLNMTVMALELATELPDYEDIAIQCYMQFLAIADTIDGAGEYGLSLWNEDAGFFMDLLVHWEHGRPTDSRYVQAYSWVGLIPLFAVEVIDDRLLDNVPRFRALLVEHKGGLFHGRYVCACPEWQNDRGERLLALVDHTKLAPVLSRLLRESEFLSPYGIRSTSRMHADQPHVGWIPGHAEPARVEYNPGESTTGLFGGNSNWRGPVWLPTNYSLIQALETFHRFLGDDFRVSVAGDDSRELTLREAATLIAERLVDLYRRNDDGIVPALRRDSPFQTDPHWRELTLFYEYFHAETGQGLGAAHQTGWTALLANLVMRRYQRDITPWSGLDHGATAAPIDEIA